MQPFRIFDKSKKATYLVLNYQPGEKGGSYLVARDDESSEDGKIAILAPEDIAKCQMVGIVVEA
ncbi:MAG: hypothetical protein OXT67_11495 [Zetaproteobacteria bacterium]|nr:hypothetical protein [Zetaproteobacteria bacterium]